MNREIRRRTDVVGIFPDRTSLIRLGLDVLANSRLTIIDGTATTEEVTLPALTA